MAIEDIDKMTAPLSRRGETQMAMSDAPEDYLKRAREAFIIEFPEFEDLWGEELDKEMEKKGWFSDRYAMSDPDPMAEKWDMYQDKIKDGSYTGTWEDFLLDFEDAVDIPYAAKGGIIGLRFGGDPKLEQELEQIHNPAENGQQGIMQLAGGFSGDDIIQSAMIWMAGLPGSDGNPIGMDEVIRQLNVGETDINGLVNAYMDAKVDSN